MIAPHCLLPVVRKIAQDRKDKLGPQWTSWVGKAVRKLVRMPFDCAMKILIDYDECNRRSKAYFSPIQMGTFA